MLCALHANAAIPSMQSPQSIDVSTRAPRVDSAAH
ncbi:hypothetical protein XF_2751 [Xylella fastidiosa 9a5c]|uniref:Uncharacterized protein n=1 Tax=Xylella fastidiosa (strain 9a5c) TaxID=160492 RepID=Q9P9W9_XYLFA|nr:hypothetical protein XF_2751 [Xylella fastidiosa 9a5c]